MIRVFVSFAVAASLILLVGIPISDRLFSWTGAGVGVQSLLTAFVALGVLFLGGGALAVICALLGRGQSYPVEPTVRGRRFEQRGCAGFLSGEEHETSKEALYRALRDS